MAGLIEKAITKMLSEEKIVVAYTDSPIGILKISFELDSHAVIKISKEKSLKNIKKSKFVEAFIQELSLYFKGQLYEFKYPVKLFLKSEFQKKVLEKILKIPYGKTVTYKKLAEQLNTSPRAIGQALKFNPLPIVFPCHRVIKTNGEIGGYSLGIDAKIFLLNHEKTILYKLRSHKV